MIDKTFLVPAEIVACIAEGRDATVEEIGDVAIRILSDVRGRNLAFTLGAERDDASARLVGLRLARAALMGEGAGSPSTAASEGKSPA